MEAIIGIILSIVAKTVVGRYATKMLEKIDAGLAKMFTDRKSPKEIKTYIEKNDLEEKFGGFTKELLNDSVVVPSVASGAPTPETKAEFFSLFLEMGFFLSNRWQTDLVLPGSFIGENTLSIFGNNSQGVPKISRNKVEITWETPTRNYLRIIALPDEKVKSYFDYYRKTLHQYKSDFSTYATLSELFPSLKDISENSGVVLITAGSVIFKFGSLMGEDQISALGIEGGRAKIQSWQSGLDRMVESVPQVADALVLPGPEDDDMQTLIDKLKNIKDY